MELSLLPERLLPWFEQHQRDLPWRKNRDPYRVWLSEIMLQQTRVEAVKGYYERFLTALPDVFALASVQEDSLLKLWEGLGYYNRARNLQKAAKCIAENGGVFPDTYKGLRALPGIGDYTAGAVASICFEQKTAAVDGNVLRVLARLREDETPVNDAALKKRVKSELEAVYPAGRCGDFTQALMELGATVCVPNGTPNCMGCPLRDICGAYAAGTTEQYPVKTLKKPRKQEELTVFLLYCGEKLAIRKRKNSGLLAGMWELPHVSGVLSPEQAAARASDWGCAPRNVLRRTEKKHIFTHMEWSMTGYAFSCDSMSGEFLWADAGELETRYALPTAFRQFLDGK